MTVYEFDFKLRWSPGDPDPALFQNWRTAVLILRLDSKHHSSERFGALKFAQAALTRLGPPGDENLKEHPLWSAGLESILFGGVSGTESAAATFGTAARSVDLTGLQHFVLILKDFTFDCVAEAVTGETFATREDALRSLRLVVRS